MRIKYENILSPYGPTDYWTARKMTDLAKPRKVDVLADLGSGEGDIIFVAAEPRYKFAKVFGIEYDDGMIERTRNELKTLGLENKVEIIDNDIFNVDLSELNPRPTIFTLSFTWGGLMRLKPKLEKELEPRTRIVTNSRELTGWKTSRPPYTTWNGNTIFVYEIGKT